MLRSNQTYAHPQNQKYRGRIKVLTDYADELIKKGKPILRDSLVKQAMIKLSVTERTAKQYADAVIIILQDK